MIRQGVTLFLLTFFPFFELRASIPLGILDGRVDLPFHYYVQGFGMSWYLVFFICVSANILLGPLLYRLVGSGITFLRHVPFINRFYQWKVRRTHAQVAPLIHKYGPVGLALFIAVPLPGSGTYSGTLAAHILGLNKNEFFWANLVGVILAGILVTIVSLGVNSAL